MLGKIFESLYNKVFVNIIVDRSKSTVYIEMCSKDKVVNSYEEVFSTNSLNNNMLEFIATNTEESPYHYISILDRSATQGAIPTCSKNKIAYYEDVSSVEYKCFNEKWTYFTSQEELYSLQKDYEKLGLDFIFSPFVILADFFEDKINDHMAMFILIEDSYISLSVFDNGQLLFSEHLDLEHTANDELLLYEDINEFTESKDVEEEFNENILEDEMPINEADGFNEDYQRFALIQSAVNGFYKDERYDSVFIESVYIADGVGVSNDLKRYLEEEMFLSVYIRHVDLATRVCELAKSELGI